MSYSQDEIDEYKKEWKYWLGGAIIFFAVYVFFSARSGSWGFSPFLIPPIIWAVILIVAPLFSKSKSKHE